MAKLDKSAALEAAKTGSTVNEIALQQGVTYQAVWRYLKTQKVDLQKSADAGGDLSDNGEDEGGHDLKIAGGSPAGQRQVNVRTKEYCNRCGGDLERCRLRDDVGNITGIIYQCIDCEALYEIE